MKKLFRIILVILLIGLAPILYATNPLTITVYCAIVALAALGVLLTLGYKN